MRGIDFRWSQHLKRPPHGITRPTEIDRLCHALSRCGHLCRAPVTLATGFSIGISRWFPSTGTFSQPIQGDRRSPSRPKGVLLVLYHWHELNLNYRQVFSMARKIRFEFCFFLARPIHFVSISLRKGPKWSLAGGVVDHATR